MFIRRMTVPRALRLHVALGIAPADREQIEREQREAERRREDPTKTADAERVRKEQADADKK